MELFCHINIRPVINSKIVIYYSMTLFYYKSSNGFKRADIDFMSPKIQEGEDIAWSYTETKGILKKHFSMLLTITQFRIFCYDFKINKMIGLLKMSELDDAVVLDSYRSYSSMHYGSYASFASGFGVTGSQSHGQSMTKGTIVFMKGGEVIIRLGVISDPNGVRRLTLAIKKELYPKKELERFLTKIRVDELPISSTCSDCGGDNTFNSSFCSKCGRVLR